MFKKRSAASDTGPPQVLPVGDGDDHVDLDKPATNALEYLRQVRHEANQLPEVTFAASREADIEIAIRESLELPQPESVQAVYEPEMVDRIAAFREWQQQQVRIFSEDRQVFNRWKARGVPEPKPHFPAITDRQAWNQFCLGDRGRQPVLQIVLHLQQTQVKALLEFHLGWLSVTPHSFTDLQGSWLYALLSCLDRLLDADTTACLRNICKQCSLLVIEDEAARTMHNGTQPLTGDAAGLHLFITIVSYYFGQSDLCR